MTEEEEARRKLAYEAMTDAISWLGGSIRPSLLADVLEHRGFTARERERAFQFALGRDEIAFDGKFNVRWLA